MKGKKKTIAVQMSEQQMTMIEAMKSASGMPTFTGALMYCLAYTYQKHFPSYSGKPTPIQAGSPNQVVNVAKARALNKQVVNQAEDEGIIESGKYIAHLLSARITGEGGGIKEIGMAVERLDNSGVVSELASSIKLIDIPHRSLGNYKTEIGLQHYLLETKFRDLDFSADPERVHKKLTMIAKYFVTAIEKGEAKPKQFRREVCELLLEKMTEHNVDCGELEQTLLETGFMQ